MNDAILQLMVDMTRRRFDRATDGDQYWVDLAIRIAPYGLVRPYLGRAIPARVDEAVVAAADSILRLGDQVSSRPSSPSRMSSSPKSNSSPKS